MKHYEAETTIAAPPERIWSILTDAPAYSEWDNAVIRLDGRVAPGERLKITAETDPGRAHPIKVTEFEPGERMTWTGGMPLGLFKGARTFTLTPADGATRFHMREEFTGPMLPLIWKSMPDLGPSFERFARGLKAKAEAGH
jgi:hypothetical protein